MILFYQYVHSAAEVGIYFQFTARLMYCVFQVICLEKKLIKMSSNDDLLSKGGP